MYYTTSSCPLLTLYHIQKADSSSNNINYTTNKIVCLHGWLDNAASFNRMAPLLMNSLKNPTELVALDFPGHGLSGHKSPDGPTVLLAEYAYYVAECLEALQWGSTVDGVASRDAATKTGGVTVVGHSMGAGVAVVFAAAFPELCSSLVLLEGGGPLARNARDCGRHVRAACQRRLRSNRLLFPTAPSKSSSTNESNGGVRVYPNLTSAIEARLSTVKRMPGEQYMSHETAVDLVSRAVTHATINNDSTNKGEAVTFRHDPRLQWPSLQYFTREQVEACYLDIQEAKVPVCLLVAEDGYPVDSLSEKAIHDILQPCYFERLGGSHHFHADPDSVDDVVREVVQFMESR